MTTDYLQQTTKLKHKLPMQQTVAMGSHERLFLYFFLTTVISSASGFVPTLKASNISTQWVADETESTVRYGDNDNISCPKSCTCNFQSFKFEVNCESSGLQEVPKDLPKLANYLYLSNNDINRLNRWTFQNVKNVELISLTNNKLSLIHIGAFRELSHLSFLDLSINNVSQLTGSLFKGLVHLKMLNVSHLQLNLISNQTFRDLSELTSLDLSFNHIRYIYDRFSSLERLSHLDLSHNNLTDIKSSTFSNLINLRTLNLRKNSIAKISSNAFQNLSKLEDLNLSHNDLVKLDRNIFNGLKTLKRLYLQHNQIQILCDDTFVPIAGIEYINLSANFITKITGSPFKFNSKLKELVISSMPQLQSVSHKALSGLRNLEKLVLENNSGLKTIHPFAFEDLKKLSYLDISNCNLSAIYYSQLTLLPNISTLLAYGNNWVCDCSMSWLQEWIDSQTNFTVEKSENMTCSYPEQLVGQNVLQGFEPIDECTNVTLYGEPHYIMYKIGSSALLECNVTGDPQPSISWVTPKMGTLRWHPLSDDSLRVKLDEIEAQQSCNKSISKDRLQLLDNGSLYITKVMSVDAGHYMCIASNHLGSQNLTTSFLLDYRIMHKVKVVSILVGIATAFGFMLLSLLIQFIYVTINKWGFCCCEGYVSPKTRKMRKILESVESYKSQQLDRLRDNYNGQVQRIKDNCNQQLEWIQSSYSNQSERFKDIRDYSSHHLTNICDSYYDQVKRVRDYSSSQLTKVRENYLFQRNRVRKFSAHQLVKLRENYKIQQLHLNKILENLNMESCRTACGRTDSIIFDDETMFNSSFHLPKRAVEGSDIDSRASQYFTPEGQSLDGDCSFEDIDLGLGMGRDMVPRNFMIDKCIGTSVFELDNIGMPNFDAYMDHTSNYKINEGGDARTKLLVKANTADRSVKSDNGDDQKLCLLPTTSVKIHEEPNPPPQTALVHGEMD